MAVLSQQGGLYSWRLPKLPEDLSFFAADGSCFFSSTAHEKEAMLCSGDVSEKEFVEANPGLAFTWYPGHRT